MERNVKVKICGQTSLEGAKLSIDLGADFVGAVLEVPSSPRSLDLEAARPIFQQYGGQAFLLTCHMPMARLEDAVMTLDPYAVQMTGEETPEELSELKDAVGGLVYKSIHMAPAGEASEEDVARTIEMMEKYAQAGADGFVLDVTTGGRHGGTGVKSDWSLAARVIAASTLPVFIAGGINPANVAEAAALPGVYGVDLASGVETGPGVKSEEKLTLLFAALRGQ